MAKPRIIGGSAKGRSLETPKRGTRPSPARLREALFNILEFYERGRFLDLYSGTGAMGLEAASRGWSATCVELDRRAADVIRRNARHLGLKVSIEQTDALNYARRHPETFDVVVAAPPYPLDLADIFQTLLEARPVRPGGLYVFQHPSRSPLALRLPAGMTERSKAYGSNTLSLYTAPLT